ncbi:Acetate CoA-transferase subunit alpha [Sporomusa silvacetica DSM 10669]|uniref:Acetate CoA-transferase subunit alpha n=1 Tax=Sporomusa silvacetica DSM 10669 TaxID=1123289 RepID=A0ABZ3IU82_9FIRM|nr:CoA transferase subunit A [Sporomusa silvacetica]OZC22316.1 acetate CoA-transferase subunit alpha [Sporomusa silvacetica DSM 10669]
MTKITTVEQAMEKIRNESTIMIGGFVGCGTPDKLIDAMIDKKLDNLTIIANDTSFPEQGIGKLIAAKRVKKLIASYIGANPETGRQMQANELEVELVPQGTLAERIRSGGAGLGGVLTPTGLGTVVAEGKEIIVVDGQNFLLEKPLKAEFALIKAHKADESGNLVFRRSARNFNPVLATAADIVVAEVQEIVPVGELDPDEVMLPGIFVDYIVKG